MVITVNEGAATPEKCSNPGGVIAVCDDLAGRERGARKVSITTIVPFTTNLNNEPIWARECCAFMNTVSADYEVRLENHVEVANISLRDSGFDETIPNHTERMIREAALEVGGISMHIENVDGTRGRVEEWCGRDGCCCSGRHAVRSSRMIACAESGETKICYCRKLVVLLK